MLATVAFMTLTVSSANGAVSHLYLERFGAAAKPSLSSPSAAAVDQANGQIYVALPFSGKLSRFNADGTGAPFAALGTNQIGGFAFEATAPQRTQIAIDNSGTSTDGNIYVAEGFGNSIKIFAPTGVELGQLSQFKEGSTAEGSTTGIGSACGVAVDSSGAVYVGDVASNQIHKYVPSGSVPVNADNVANLPYPKACTLAAGTGPTAAFLFANTEDGDLAKLDKFTGEVKYTLDHNAITVTVDPSTGHVYAVGGGFFDHYGFDHYDVSGDNGATTLASVAFGSSGDSEEGIDGDGIAVRGSTGNVYVSAPNPDPSRISVYTPLLTLPDVEALPAEEVSATKATLHGIVNPQGLAPSECKFEYGNVKSPKFTGVAPCQESLPGDEEPHEVSAVVSGLPSNGSEYKFRLVVKNSSTSNTSGVETFKTPLRVFTGPPQSVSSASADIAGVARPEGNQLSECYFEYGTSTLYESFLPCTPEAESVPADFGAYAVSAHLSGLAPYTTYHYRLVIADEFGQLFGKDEVFKTRGVSGLPNGRVYEQVSPVDKNESDILSAGGVAAVDGNRIHFMSRGAFADSPTALGADGLPYMATRGPDGWSTKGIAMPNGRLTLGLTGYQGLTPDLSKGVISWADDTAAGPYDPNAPSGRYHNLYMLDTATGSFQLLNGTLDNVGWQRGFVWGSQDFSKLAIDSPGHLTVDSPCTDSSNGGGCAYEWDNGELRLASVLPNEEPTEGAVGQAPYFCNFEHSVSDDGSRLFFTSPRTASNAVESELYVRENGTKTHELSLSERTLPGGASGKSVFYQSAEAAQGDRVLFITANSLVDEDTDSTRDLYMYDFTKPDGEHLTLISEDQNPSGPVGANVPDVCGGFIGASEDLRRVYFAANNQIVEGEPNDPGPKIFLWDDTGSEPKLIYIGAVNSLEVDYEVWRAPSVYLREGSWRAARWSTDGRYIAFISTAQLTEFDNEGRKEIYFYDAVADSLQCASCSGDAFPPEGDIAFNSFFFATFPLNHLVKNISDKGQLFFHTSRGLTPRDSNGKMDVYQYEDGRLDLISKGTGAYDSFFLDASPSGDDVFFVSKDKLVGWDTDQNVDVYDARVGGGFPEPPPSPPACEGDSCQPPPVAPDDPSPSSAGLSGPGNPTLRKPRRRCGAGKVRRAGKCRKRKRAGTSRKRAHKQATRSHG